MIKAEKGIVILDGSDITLLCDLTTVMVTFIKKDPDPNRAIFALLKAVTIATKTATRGTEATQIITMNNDILEKLKEESEDL